MEYLQYFIFGDTYSISIAVLNLIINGIPSIPDMVIARPEINKQVLNLIINGIPSIL